MSQGTLNLDGHNLGTITIDPLRIGASGGLDYPPLTVQVDFALQPVEYEHGTFTSEPSPTVQHYTLVELSGRMSYARTTGGVVPLADFTTKPILMFTGNGTGAHPITIVLDPYRLHRLEEQRMGDITFQFDITCLFARHPRVSRAEQNTAVSVEALKSYWLQITGVQVPQSRWVTLLPELGYGAVQIIEIPLPHGAIPNTFTRSVVELRLAQQDMQVGEYDNVVAHCRTAIELMTEAVPLVVAPGERPPTFRQKIDHLFSTMAASLTNEHRTQLPAIINGIWGLTSRAVHPHAPGAFSRADADAIMLMTSATLAYTGRLLNRHQSASSASSTSS